MKRSISSMSGRTCSAFAPAKIFFSSVPEGARRGCRHRTEWVDFVEERYPESHDECYNSSQKSPLLKLITDYKRK